MANHKAAKKSIRKIERRTEVNRNRVSRVRTYVKKAEAAVGVFAPAVAENTEEAVAAVRKAESELMKAVKTGVMHKNAAARKVSRLTKRIKAIA